jgi:hypothetical protein
VGAQLVPSCRGASTERSWRSQSRASSRRAEEVGDVVDTSWNRTGGRIVEVADAGFPEPVETGPVRPVPGPTGPARFEKWLGTGT